METTVSSSQPPAVADTILIADDDAINRAILANLFSPHYRIREANDGREALAILKECRSEICAILLDVVMPEVDGLALLEHLARHGVTAEIPIFLITARTDNDTVRTAYALGAMDVIRKPIIPYIAERRINSVIELFRARKSLSAMVDEQQSALDSQARRIASLNEGMIEALSAAIEFRNGESGEHIRRIRGITEEMLRSTELGNGLTDEDIRQIGLAAVMHDVGKIAIPDAILNKPGRLTPDEFEVIKTHTTAGAKLLDQIPQLKENSTFPFARDITLHHHERWDGNGYPDKLKGSEISTWAQVVSIADVYDALVSKRCYKGPIPPDRAIEMIKNGECGIFNPRLVEVFLKIEPQFRPIYEKEGSLHDR